VLIQKDPTHFGIGTIQAASYDRREVVAELSRMEALEQSRQRDVRENWTQQQFQMDRQEHTKGHTL
jgi:hypothetical protein